MTTYNFLDGTSISTKLSKKEMLKRMNRLSTLIAILEGYEEGVGVSIYNKILNAFNKTINFTGIIRLSNVEKDFLSYQFENDMLTDKDIEVITFYCCR